MRVSDERLAEIREKHLRDAARLSRHDVLADPHRELAALLAELQEHRAREAVSGHGEQYVPPAVFVETWVGYPVNDAGQSFLPATDADAEFIAFARTALPRALAELWELRERFAAGSWDDDRGNNSMRRFVGDWEARPDGWVNPSHPSSGRYGRG